MRPKNRLLVVADSPESPEVSVMTDRAEAAGWAVTTEPFASNWSATSLASASETARIREADWVFFLKAGDRPHPNLFQILAPYLEAYDAIWGGLSLIEEGSDVNAHGKLMGLSRLACQDYAGFFHLALHWWIGGSHMIQSSRLNPEFINALNDQPDWYVRYLISLWQGGRCIKTAQALTLSTETKDGLHPEERARLLQVLRDDPVFLPVRINERIAFLPYTGENLNVEREQTRGLFYEEAELWDLVKRIPKNARIVDVGANTGNHSIFFAMALPNATVVALEPLERNIEALQAAAGKNELNNLDLSKLGYGAGAVAGRANLDRSAKSLGDTRLETDPDGEITVLTLDELIEGPVDLIKVDVEGMELEVLEGAKRVLEEFRPILFIEIADSNGPEFMAWLSLNPYRIARIYPDKTHSNYILVPASFDGLGQLRSG